MINPTRLKEIAAKPLHKGNGKDLDHACIMQMVAYVADEPWSDRPECASKVLTSYAISLNDHLSDKRRQGLAPLIPLLVGTNVPSLEKVRANFLVGRMLTVTFPIFTDSLNLPEISAKLRAVENSKASMQGGEMKSRDFCYWLQGFFEISESQHPGGAFAMGAASVACMRNHLAMVFEHEIDPAMGDIAHQEALTDLHGGGGTAQPPKHRQDTVHGQSAGGSGIRYRC